MSIKKCYRPNVAAIIVSSKYPLEVKFFIALRTDIKDAWQFPQGGIDSAETPLEALFRELKEEIGTNSIDVLGEYPKWISYDFPKSVAKKMSPFKGQIQKYFLVKLKDESKIDLKTKNPEFCDFKFINKEEVLEHTTSFKSTIYKEVLEYFKSKGYF